MPFSVANIVCALDFSADTPPVVDCGITLAQNAGARLHLVHTVSDPQDRVHPTTLFERGGDLDHRRDLARERIRVLMGNAPVTWRAVIDLGDPVEQIHALVDGLSHCLMISASHGVSGLQRIFRGTVVERLSRSLGCPMLVIKPDIQAEYPSFQRFDSAVVCCDEHGHWQRQADVLNLLRADDALHVHLIHAMEGPPSAADSRGVSYGQAQQAWSQRMQRELETAARRVFPWAAGLEVDVAPGLPAEMALQAARHRSASLITVGVRRSGRVGRWIAGSTTETLLRQAPCSVLTLPEPMPTGSRPGVDR